MEPVRFLRRRIEVGKFSKIFLKVSKLEGLNLPIKSLNNCAFFLLALSTFDFHEIKSITWTVQMLDENAERGCWTKMQ